MLYIDPEQRESLDIRIDWLVRKLRDTLKGGKPYKGAVDYAITRIVLETLGGDDSFSDCVSVLRDSADEIQRRLLAPYEDRMLKQNGDIQCFQTAFDSYGMYVQAAEATCNIMDALTDEQFKEAEEQFNEAKRFD